MATAAVQKPLGGEGGIKTWDFDSAIANLMYCGEELAQAKSREMELEFGRHTAKSEAISRIMNQPDPQKDNKPYSATAAEKLVETDAAYALHLQDQRLAVVETIRAQTAYEAAKFICRYVAAAAEVSAA